MNIAIILAGGKGTRLGADVPKQFIEVFNKPVIAYTLDIFENHSEIDAIEIVCVKSHIDYLKEIVERYNYKKVKWITQGGKEFQHSVMNGINYLEDKVQKDDIILIHWAASPFVSDEIISDGIEVARKKGNAIAANPCYLLYGSNDGEKSTKYIDRTSIMTMSAPQCFKYICAKELYDIAAKKGLIDKVEPHTTSLMYELNYEIYFSKGSQTNIKITKKEDLELFKYYILGKTKLMEYKD